MESIRAALIEIPSPPPSPGGRGSQEVAPTDSAEEPFVFAVQAHDGIDVISKGRHERLVIDRERFDANAEEKKKG